MKPFADKLEKLAASEGWKHVRLANLEAGWVSGAETNGTESALSRVDTYILVANKRVYLEAIEVFYKKNTIIFNLRLCDFMVKKESLQATDVSLATHIVTKIEATQDRLGEPSLDRWSVLARSMTANGLRSPFPRLESGTVFLYTDASVRPTRELFGHAASCRIMGDTVHFDGVGSLVATLKGQPKITLRVQHRKMIQHWADCDQVLDQHNARALYNRFRADPVDFLSSNMKSMAALHVQNLLPPGYPPLDLDGYEFWTCMEWFLRGTSY